MKISHISSAFRVAAIYAIFAGLWILLSDKILFILVTDQKIASMLATYKGWAFVLVTTYLLYWELKKAEYPGNQWPLLPVEPGNHIHLILAILLPFLTMGLQWILWPYIAPFAWFLFFPAVFFSARLGGFKAGLFSTLLSAAFVWFFFIPPQFSWDLANPYNFFLLIVFIVMGYFFSDTQERLKTASRLANIALGKSEARFNLVMTQVNDIVWAAALDGSKILEVNQAFEKIYGTSVTNFKLNPNLWMEVVHPDDQAVARTSVEALRKNGQATAEYRILRPDGAMRWILDRKSILYDNQGKPMQIGGIGQDITERKQAEKAAFEGERQMSALVTSLDDIVFELDEQGTYLNIWTADESLLAMPKDQMLGRGIVEVLGEENGRPFADAIKRVIASGSPETIEYPLEVIDGQHWFLARIGPVITQDGSYRTASMLVRDITERKQADEQVQLQLQRLRALSEIDRAINAGLDIRLSLDIILNRVLSQLGVDAAMILLFNTYEQTLEYVAGLGFRTAGIRQAHIPFGEGLAGRIGLERKILHIPNLAELGSQFKRAELLKHEKFVDYFGIPLIAKGLLKGVLEIFHRTPLNPDNEWLNYLETLGGQAAIAIDNSQLFEGMQQSNIELVTAYDATIAGWSSAMDLRDKETEGHSQRVTELTLKLAERMGINQQEQIQIRRGALLHDIGKLGVPDQILLKPGKLTEEEWVIMRQHPTFALALFRPISYLLPALDIPYCHHEKWDGSGYPRGLKGEQIPLAARIFAVVDVWDALRSDRPYRAGWSAEKIRAYIVEQSGKHFEPRVTEAFLDLLNELPDLQ